MNSDDNSTKSNQNVTNELDNRSSNSNELDMDAYHEEGIEPGEHKVFDISPEIHTFGELKPTEPGEPGGTFRDVLRGWLRGTNPSPQRAQIVDQLLGHTEIGEQQAGLHNLNIGDIVNMKPEDIIGTDVGMTIPKDIAQSFIKSLSEGSPQAKGAKPLTGILADRPSGPTIRKLLDSGMSNKEMADIFEMSPQAFQYYMRKEGLESNYPTGPRPQEQIKTQKDLAPIVQNFRLKQALPDLINQGKSYGEIADQFGVSRNAVAGLVNRAGLKKTKGEPSLPKTNLPKFEEGDYSEEIKALSDWYSKQFEGGPIESEGPNSLYGRSVWNNQDNLRTLTEHYSQGKSANQISKVFRDQGVQVTTNQVNSKIKSLGLNKINDLREWYKNQKE